MISSIQIFYLTVLFLVPGFISEKTRSLFNPIKTPESYIKIMPYLTQSCINYAVWSWLIYKKAWLIYKKSTELDTFDLYVIFDLYDPYLIFLFSFLIVFLSPVIIGLFIGYVESKNIVRKIFHRMGIKIIDPNESSWDWKFSRISEPIVVHVLMKDNVEYRGLFGSKSFASSKLSTGDIYLQEVFNLEEDVWTRDPHSDGVWLPQSEIKSVEFIKIKRNGKRRQKEQKN